MAARKKRRRRLGGTPPPLAARSSAGRRSLSGRRFQHARRWFAVGALVLVGLLYYRPLHDYFDARSQRAVRVAVVRKLQREQAALEKRLDAGPPDALQEVRLDALERLDEELWSLLRRHSERLLVCCRHRR